MDISYSDGKAVESRILKLLNETQELGSADAIAEDEYADWPVRYHLCPERANLIRHLDFRGLDVLELGAGMGALSRYIAETARTLTVIEGTESRYRALQARLRDLKNWKGHVANIQDVTLTEKFDVVCVFGVLEYAEMYLTPPAGKSAFQHFLEKATSHLKPDGALIIAIENKLGIKYWSGAAEDHTGTLFEGIAGYSLDKSPRTFSRKELRALLEGTGFNQIQEQYPFPDYKIPSSVISRDLMERDPALAADIATQQPYQNYGLPRFHTFPEALAVPNLAQAGLLPEFANSFLFVASRSESPALKSLLARHLEKHELAWHYSSSRKTPTDTTFLLERDEIQVRKAAATASKLFESPEMKVEWKLPEQASISPGMKLKTRLLNHAYFSRWNLFLEEFTAFLQWSANHWKEGSSNQLRGGALDATFVNAAQGNNGFDLFDLEWELKSPMSTSWFVLRNAYLFLHEVEIFSSSAPFASLHELYTLGCKRLGIPQKLNHDIEQELSFQLLVTRQTDRDALRLSLLQLLNEPFAPSPFPRSPRSVTLAGQRKIGQIAQTLQRIPGFTRLVKSVLR